VQAAILDTPARNSVHNLVPATAHSSRGGRRTRHKTTMANHALLLRLFLTPSFFNVHVALQYLALYPDNIGITYYIVGRLRELPLDAVKDVWNFLWYTYLLCYVLI
jgi:hypothetical protein